MAEHMSRKKSALIDKKKTLLNKLKYYELKLKEEKLASNNNNMMCDDSSDSENEFTVDVGLSITELKLKQRSLKTCLQATQELTGLIILESEVNLLVQDPVFDGEPAVHEEGVWREVTAECRIDLVPFSINFYVHKASRMFGSTSFRNLQVTPVKPSHEVELARSVLNSTRQPADAVEVIRNYSAAHRSRRSTLARLAEKYEDALFMAPMPEGGYKLKCAGLMEVQWTLQNKWSPIAAFHHRMVFDLEFMDETYIKTISALHKQIIDPTIDTDERTLLLAKIIDTCLEAKATQNAESTESETEAAETVRRRRTTLDQEPQEPERKRKKDSEVMAPPKSLPKKTKPKGKENTGGNAKPVKRTADDIGDKQDAKKPKAGATDKNSKIDKDNKTDNKADENRTDKENKIDKHKKGNDNTDQIHNADKKNKADKNKIHQANNANLNKEDKLNKAGKDKKIDKENNANKNNKTDKINKEGKDDKPGKDNKVDKVNKAVRVNKADNLDNGVDRSNENEIKNSNVNTEDSGKTVKRDKQIDKVKQVKKDKIQGSNKEAKQLDKGKNQQIKENQIRKDEDSRKSKVDNVGKEKITQQKEKSSEKLISDTDKEMLKVNKDLNKKKHTELDKEANKGSKSNLIKSKTQNDGLKTTSKEPQNFFKNQFLKKSSIPKQNFPTRIPRISPRKLSSLKPSVHSVSKTSISSQKSLQKSTNIPRLLKKPLFKTNKV